MKRVVLLLAWTLAVLLASCGSVKTEAYYDLKTQCIGSELDGSITVRSFGRARTARDSYQQARKQAVYDVVFSTIKTKDGGIIKPLVSEPNAKEKYQRYFDDFFSDKGAFEKYCSMKEKRFLSSRWRRTDTQSVCETTVCVYRGLLKDKLIEDGIIK